MSEEKRHSPRVPYLCEVACDMFTGDLPQTFRLSDISVEGAFIEALVELPAGSRMGLRFQIGDHKVQAKAVVTQAMPHFGMGVRFTEISDEDRAAIERLVRVMGG